MTLSVEGLTKRYQSSTGFLQAINGVSFNVARGEIVALLGPNGSGKTTTLQCITGLTTPDEGRVLIDGAPREGWSSKLSYLAGDAEFYWMFTGGTIISNYARIYGTPQSRIEDLVNRFEMGGRLQRKWHQYSSGEQMRIRLIRALLNDPEILLLDEPTSGLDPAIANSLRKELALLRDNGTAILLTSHHLVDIERLANRVCFLLGGKIAHEGTLGDFRKPLNVATITYEASPRSVPDWMTAISESTFSIPLSKIQEAAGLGVVRSIRSEEESLESYFLRVSQEPARSKEGRHT
jgi:ABC-type multidrug transport system ATPase subunit